jgi:histidinol-phosphate/aromatic aminotransferase/cobyric acid decarboxylase-like protein
MLMAHPEGAILAMRESLTDANRYPDSTEALQEKLARLHKSNRTRLGPA